MRFRAGRFLFYRAHATTMQIASKCRHGILSRWTYDRRRRSSPELSSEKSDIIMSSQTYVLTGYPSRRKVSPLRAHVEYVLTTPEFFLARVTFPLLLSIKVDAEAEKTRNDGC